MILGIQIIITSAVTASIVSGIVLIINGYWERKSRRQNEILKIAFELAKERTKFVWEVAKTSGKPAIFQDAIVNMETYHQWLNHLDKTGSLPPEAKKFSE